MFIDNDPTEKLLKFMAEENEKSRKHEMERMKLMFSQPHPPFQEHSSSIPFHYHSPCSSGNSCPFQQITFHQITSRQKENETPRIRFLSAMCYKHRPLQRIILYGLPIEENITSKQWMFYRSYSILTKKLL